MKLFDWLSTMPSRTRSRRLRKESRIHRPAENTAHFSQGLARQTEQLETRLVLSATGGSAQQAVWFAAGLGQRTSGNESGSHGDEWIVRLNSAALHFAKDVDSAAELLTTDVATFEAVRGLGLPGQVLVRPINASSTVAAAALSASPWLSYFEPNGEVLGPQETPNDPSFGVQYGLDNVGQNGGSPDADIDATEAWEITTGDPRVVVAVLDSGVDYTHPDLAANIWINQQEIPSAFRNDLIDTDLDGVITFRDLNHSANTSYVSDINANGMIDGGDLLDDLRWSDGVDGDSNGRTDDLIGFDFSRSDRDPLDEHRHGTHVAGIVGAVGNNGLGISGVSQQVAILPLRFLDENNRGDTAAAIAGINYATMLREDGANIRVINASFGSSGDFNPGLRDAIQNAAEADILFVAAAGNGDFRGLGIDNDTRPFYPASLSIENVISVAATDSRDAIADFSNFGDQSVDLAAPGVGILSTEPNGRFGSRSGTSMAAPMVAGGAALYFAHYPDATATEAKDALLNSADRIDELIGVVKTGARLNVFRALSTDTIAPRVAGTDDLTTGGESLAPEVLPVEELGVSTAIVKLSWTDRSGIDASTIDGSDLIIRRAEELASTLTVTVGAVTTSDSVAGSDTVTTVEYHVHAPTAFWEPEDNGEYEIELVRSAVRDNVGNTNRGERLAATLKIDVPNVGTIRVDTFADGADTNPGDGHPQDADGNRTLRAAIQEANAIAGENTIILPGGVYTLSLSGAGEDAAAQGDLDIVDTDTLTIVGTTDLTPYFDTTQPRPDPEAPVGPDNQHPLVRGTIIDAASLDRIFDVHPGATLVLRNIVLRNGSVTGGADGGAILNNGTLELVNSAITNSSATGNDGGDLGDGGGIANFGTVTLFRSTVSGNTASGSGGGAYVASGSTSEISISTISGNTAVASGGGIFNDGTSRFVSTTIAVNHADGVGGGVHGASDVSLINTLIADNTAGSSDPDTSGSFLSESHNFVSNVGTATGLIDGVIGDVVGSSGAIKNARLSPLSDHGGLTETHRLLPGSSASAVGTANGILNIDQRGLPRISSDGLDDFVDIGSFERFYAEIRGRKFLDRNADGEQQLTNNPFTNEPGLGGWTIYLDINNNGQLDSSEPSTETAYDDPTTPDEDEGGFYEFINLNPGTYEVAEIPQQDFTQTTPRNLLFDRAPDVPSGREASAVSTADFDLDGRPDLVVANFGDNTVTVSRGKGQGEFYPPLTLSVGEGPTDVTTGDFNRDSFPDIAVTNSAASQIVLLFGNGDGLFPQTGIVALSGSPDALTAADLDGDLSPDLIVSLPGSDQIRLLFNDGAATFDTATNLDVGAGPTSVNTFDMNLDGHTDLLVTNGDANTVSIFTNNGDGSFASPSGVFAGGVRPIDATAGDFNDDGRVDLAVLNADSDAIALILRRVDDTFAAPVTYPVGADPTALISADVDFNGSIDLAVSASSGTVSILTNTTLSSGTITGQAVDTITVNSTADVADNNPGDGTVDTGNVGEVTLRAAVQEANADAGDETITLPAGTYTLNSSGLTVSNDTITIQGVGAGSTIIQVSNLADAFSVSAGATLQLSGITIQGSFGGGDNSAITSSGTLTISDSEIIGLGGGRLISSVGASARLTTADVIVSGGVTTTSGDAGNGGGIRITGGVAELTRTTVKDSVSGWIGGGVDAINADVTVRDSLISDNTATWGGGLRIATTTAPSLVDSTSIINNRGNNNAGGMIIEFSSTHSVTVENSTISGNTGSNVGGGIGIHANSADAIIRNSTITNNQGGTGGGIRLLNTGPPILFNTVVAGNTATDGDNFGHDINGTFTSQGGNFIGKSDGSSGLTNGVNSDQVGSVAAPLDSQLAELALVNGSMVHLPISGSPLIDSGLAVDAPTTDQIGRTRPQDGNLNNVATVDIGAVEFGDDPNPNITGKVFNDSNVNGVQDSGEVGLSGIRVYVDSDANGVYTVGEVTTFTIDDDSSTPDVDEAGNYALTVASGSTTVRIVPPLDFVAATPASGQRDIVVPSGGPTENVYNPGDDFSASTNPNGVWTYGWTDSLGSTFSALENTTSNLEPFPDGVTVWNRQKGSIFQENPAIYHNSSSTEASVSTARIDPNELLLHPGSGTEHAVLRFTAQTAGTHSIDGVFEVNDASGSSHLMDVYVFHNDSQAFTAQAAGSLNSETPFNIARDLAVGDTIDFSVGNAGSFGGDSTGLTATVTAPNTRKVVTDVNFGLVAAPGSAVDDPAMTIDNVAVSEGDSGTIEMVFTVSLAAPSVEEVKVDFSTSDISAVAGVDYSSNSGTLTFAPTMTSQTITVEILGNESLSANRSFSLDLSNPVNAVLGETSGRGTILEDDFFAVVNTTSDLPDVNPGDGTASAAGGEISLRAAVQEAAIREGNETIFLGAGTYSLSSSGFSLSRLSATNHSITIVGAGADTTLIDANDFGTVFNVTSGARLDLVNVTLTGSFGGSNGSAITSQGTLDIRDSILSVENGGQGRLIRSSGANADVTLLRSTVTGGRVSGGSGVGNGGAIHIDGGRVELNQAIVSDNSSDYEGGAIYARNVEFVMRASLIDQNTGQYGGGINLAFPAVRVLVESSAITRNHATSNMGGFLIANSAAPSHVVNTTISGNSAVSLVGGFDSFENSVAPRIVNSTITDNSAATGGGVWAITAGPPVLLNTIVAGNSASSSDPDIHGSIVSAGGNLIGIAATGQGVTHGGNQDQVGTVASPIDPLLGSLQPIGGDSITLAHTPLANSPLIDRGVEDGAATVDQRGVNRPIDGANEATSNFDLTDNYSSTDNPNGVWTYGSKVSGNPTGAFTLFDENGNHSTATDFNYWSSDVSAVVPFIGKYINDSTSPLTDGTIWNAQQVTLHAGPGPIGNVAAVARFSAPTDGTYSIEEASFEFRSNVAGTRVYVYQNDTQLFSGVLGNRGDAISMTPSDVTLSAGDTIDFFVDSRADGGTNSTTTQLNAVITAPNTVSTKRTDIGAIEFDLGSISGRVFQDQDASGTLNGEEAGLTGVTVFADVNNNGSLDTGEPSTTTTTDEAGSYLLLAPAGTRSIVVSSPDGFQATAPADGIRTVDVQIGETVTADFGFAELPTLSISDVMIVEGDTGTSQAVFAVSLSESFPSDITVDFATNDGTATGGENATDDYVATSGTLTFEAGTTSQAITVDVRGNDTTPSNVVLGALRTFTVELSNAVNAAIEDASGLGTIIEDDVTFVVNSTADGSDATPGDGVAQTATGETTLRAAVEEANALSSYETISLPAGVTSSGGLSISSGRIRIEGAGSDLTTVSASGLASRVFNVGASAELVGLTITGAQSNFAVDGAGILSTGTLTLDDVVVSNNRGDKGAGIAILAGQATITNSVISANSAKHGGGVYLRHALLDIKSSNISGNGAVREGGGIFVANGGVLTIDQSTVSGNQATNKAGGILIDDTFDVTVTNSTIVGNRVNSNGFGNGGGVIFDSDTGTARFTNVTISDNNGESGAGGLSAGGTGGNIVIESSTIVNNTGGGGGLAGNGVILRNTVVANNSRSADTVGNFVSQGGNFIRTVGTATGFDFAGNDAGGSDPLLSVLQSSGGVTQTHVPLPGSPLIDAGVAVEFPAVDQRGVTRPVDGNASGTATADTGSVEFNDSVITGRVYHDESANGLFDGEEAGVSAWTVFADANGNGVLDPTESSAVTASDGTYTLFAQPGSQAIRVILADDFTTTSPASGTRNFTAVKGATIPGFDFGVTQIPEITIADALIAEGDSGTSDLIFTVSLTNPVAASVMVDFTAKDGTAFAGMEFIGTSGTLTFDPRETSKTITVQVNGNTTVEDVKLFTVELTDAVDASIDDAIGIGTIIDDDLVITVNSTDDMALADVPDGTVTLRSAIELANSLPTYETVVLPAGTFRLSNGGELGIAGRVTVSGQGMGESIVDGDRHGIFTASLGAELVVEDVSLRNGIGPHVNFTNRGAVFIQRGSSVTARRVEFSGNITGQGAALHLWIDSVGLVEDSVFTGNGGGNRAGGAVYVERGALTIHRSIFRSNSTGGSPQGGGVYARESDLVITDSLFEGNTGGQGGGGGLWVEVGGNISISNTSFVNNTASDRGVNGAGGSFGIGSVSSLAITNVTAIGGSGRNNVSLTGGANQTITNSTLIGSLVTGDFAVDSPSRPVVQNSIISSLSGMFATAGGNIIVSDDGSHGFTNGSNGDRTNLDPQLGSLNPNGGIGLTLLPLPGSPAIDAGVANAVIIDQRGRSRPADGDGNSTATIDIGAVEYTDGVVTGIKYHDLNGNGVHDAGEPGLAGWTIFADVNNNGVLDSGEQSTVTASDNLGTEDVDKTGTYSLNVFAGDSVIVREVQQEGWTATAPVGGVHDVAVAIGQTVAGLAFGNAQALSVSDATYDIEGANGESGTLTFTVTLGVASSLPVTVDYQTVDGSAVAGEDYVSTNGSLTFSPGELSKTVDVTVTGDVTDEVDETFILRLLNPQNGAISDSDGVGTIVDDDSAPVVSLLDSVSLAEGDRESTSVDVTVQLSAASGKPVTVTYSTTDDSAAGNPAAAGTDYETVVEGQVTIPAGDLEATFAISIVGDFRHEGDETFAIAITDVDEAGIDSDQSSAVVTITDDDPVLTVNSAFDKPDLTPGNGIVDTGTPGEITLRAAIMEANALEGDDEIIIPPGVFTLTRTGDDDDASLGDLDVADRSGVLLIRGAGTASGLTTVIDGDDATRIFEVLSGAELQLNGVVLRNGLASGVNSNGGAILNIGQLSTTDVRIETSSAVNLGGAIHNQGTATLTDSYVVDSSASQGGGISNSGFSTLNISSTEFSGNSATSVGGAVSGPGTIHIVDSTFINNVAPTGGAVFSLADLTVERSVISANSANSGSRRGGGLFLDGGSLRLVETTVSGNSASLGGGLFAGSESSVEVRRSTFEANTAASGAAIRMDGGTVDIVNSSLFGNEASSTGGGISGSGGLDLLNVTVTANSAESSGGIGGVDHAGTLTLQNTIIAGNVGSLPDVAERMITSQGNNLIGVLPDGATGVSNGANGDLAGTTASPIDPRLEPPKLSSGLTRIVPLRHDSPAIDAGSPTNAPTVDQRGLARPEDGDLNLTAIIDIGAFELPFNQPPVIATQSFEIDENRAAGTAVGIVAASDPDQDDSITLTITDGDPDGLFVIDQLSGEITTTVPLDHEASESHAITVEVRDGGGRISTAVMTVTVADVNERPEVIGDGISDRSRPDGVGTEFIDLLRVFSDPDDGDSLTFSVTTSNSELVGGQVIDSRLELTWPSYSATQDRTPSLVTLTAIDGDGLALQESFLASSLVQSSFEYEIVILTADSATTATTTTALSASESSFAAGDNFVVEVWFKDRLTNSAFDVAASSGGVTQADVDLVYDPTRFVLISSEPSPVFDFFYDATNDAAAGRVNSAGGTSSTVQAVNPSWARLRTFVFNATSNGTGSFSLDIDDDTNGTRRDAGAPDGGAVDLHRSQIRLADPVSLLIDPDGATGAGTLFQIQTPVSVGSAANDLTASDLDGDGDVELIVVGDDSRTSIFQNAPGLTHSISVTAGEVAEDVNFGAFAASGEISGVVYFDSNQDGQRAFGESVLRGWTVFLDFNGDGVLDVDEPRDVTSERGEYSFANLPSVATYQVAVVPDPKWDVVSPDGELRQHAVYLAPAATELNVNFGAIPKTTGVGVATVSGEVFADLDGNGARDTGEVPLGGIFIYVDDDNDAVFDQNERFTTTNDQGQWSLDLPAIPELRRHIRASIPLQQETGASNEGTPVDVPVFEQTFPRSNEFVITPFSTLDQQRTVALADVTGDGSLDVVSGDLLRSGVTILANDGTGEFPQEANESGNGGFTGAKRIVPIDLNDDERTDLAILDRSRSTLSFLTSGADGNLTPSQSLAVGTFALDLVAVDLDVQSGQPERQGAFDELIVASWADNAIRVMRRTDSSQLPYEVTQQVSIGRGALAVTTGDFNDDGFADVAIARSELQNVGLDLRVVADEIVILYNDGEGNLTAGSSQLSFAPFASDVGTTLKAESPGSSLRGRSLASADFNADGRTDIVVSLQGESEILVYFQEEDGTFSLPQSVFSAAVPGAIAVTDFDENGLPDVVAAVRGTPPLALIRNLGEREFEIVDSSGSTSFLTQVPQSLAVGDINGDNLDDLLLSDADAQQLLVAVNLSRGTDHSIIVDESVTSVDFALSPQFRGTLRITLGTNDSVVVDTDSSGDLIVTINGVRDAILSGPSASLVHTLEIIGGDGDNSIDLTAVTSTHFTHADGVLINVTAGDGNDLLDASTSDFAVNLQGEAGNDTIRGGSGNDTIGGGSGNDHLTGGLGNDEIEGGTGDADRVIESSDSNFVLTTTSLSGVGEDMLSGIETAELSGGSSANSIDTTAFTGPVTLRGGDGPDTLTSGPGNDVLEGGSGNDKLSAGAGNDVLVGGNDSDTLLGGTGVDDVEDDPADASPELTITFATSSVSENSGTVTGQVSRINADLDFALTVNIVSSALDELSVTPEVTILSGQETTTFEATGVDDLILDGTQIVTVTASAAEFLSGSGILEIADNERSVTLPPDGGRFEVLRINEFLVVRTEEGEELFRERAADLPRLFITGSPTADSVTVLDDGVAVSTPLIISGNSGADNLDASLAAGPVTLDGGMGNDTLADGLASDDLFGGEGIDILVVSSTLSPNVTLTDSRVENGSVNEIGEIERALIKGDNRANTITATGFSGDTTIHAGDGDDIIKGGSGADFIAGGGGNDLIEGSDGPDTLYGEGANDTLMGLDGDDLLAGGRNSSDVLNGGDGVDAVSIEGSEILLSDAGTMGVQAQSLINTEGVSLAASTRNSLIDASGYNLGPVTIIGSNGNDTLHGSPGDDLIFGRAGHDIVNGHAGDDLIFGNRGRDSLNGEAGDDTLVGGPGSDALEGGKDRDVLRGGPRADMIHGGDEADWIHGGSGRDTLEGNLGDDTITGGAEADQLVGGGGVDILDGFTRADDFNAIVNRDSLVGGAREDSPFFSPASARPTAPKGADSPPLKAASVGVEVSDENFAIDDAFSNTLLPRLLEI